MREQEKYIKQPVLDDPTMSDSDSRTEVFSLTADRILPKVSSLLREGDMHRIMVVDPKGNIVLDIPTTVGVVGTLLFPAAAALAVTGAVAANMRIVVERRS
jgi:hypothetical protein